MIKNIKIFLASSSELSKDRKAFEREISRRNDILINKGIYIKLIIWEKFLETISVTRLQDEYNKAIKECDIFILLFATKVGKYSAEEFGVALDSFKTKERPLILTYFKHKKIKISDLTDQVNSLLAFKKRLEEMGHFTSNYKNTEGLLLHFNKQYDEIFEKYLKEDTNSIVSEVVPKVESTTPKIKNKKRYISLNYFLLY